MARVADLDEFKVKVYGQKKKQLTGKIGYYGTVCSIASITACAFAERHLYFNREHLLFT